MSLRETLQKNQKLTTAAVLVVVCAAFWILFSQTHGTDPVAATTGSFFSSDDGASFTRADGRKVRELETQNPPLYQANVYRSAKGAEFVGYLTRLPPATQQEFQKVFAEYKKGIAEAGNDAPKQEKVSDAFSAKMRAINAATEVKRPGANNKWVLLASPEGQDIINNIKAPDGSSSVDPILP